MDEFGAAFCRVAELLRRKRADPTAAPVSRFQNGHSPAGASQLARDHQPGCTSTYDDDVIWMLIIHYGSFRGR
jgi:hypothetical protein